MKMTRLVKNMMVLGVVLVLTPYSYAASIINSNTGLISPSATIIDFGVNMFPPSLDPFTDQIPGVTFGAGYFYVTTSSNEPALSGGALFNLGTTPGAITFDAPVDAAVFSWRNNPQNTTFSAFLNNTLVETFIAPTGNDGLSARFYGFEGIVFDEIRLLQSVISGYTLDNLQFNSVSQVPLPAAIWFMLTALVGLFSVGRLKAKPE